MSFSWPWALLTLLLIPALIGIGWWMRRRRRRDAVRVTSLALVRAAVPGRSRWARRIPVVLLLVAIAALGVGAARPQASVAVPSKSTTILLALDVSGSMCSTDVSPNRITAAEQQASAFIKSQAGGPRIGLVAFAGTAGLLVPPTDNTQKLLDALKGLTTSRGTAIGQSILTSIDAIAQVDPAVAPSGADVKPSSGKGAYSADAIVILTDGANTQGVEPSTAAKVAADRGVRIFTIGFGTTKPSPLVCPGQQGGGFYGGDIGGFGGFGGRGDGASRILSIDEAALKGIAKTTGGAYYRAQNADQLNKALNQLPSQFQVVHKQLELAPWFAGLGGVLAAGAVGLSLWFNRVRKPR